MYDCDCGCTSKIDSLERQVSELEYVTLRIKDDVEQLQRDMQHAQRDFDLTAPVNHTHDEY